jgi:L-rhamnose mutarotase
MKRIGRVIGLNAADIPEYKRLHATVWPGILTLLREAGMRNYSIFLKEPENLLFAYLEYEGADLEKDNLLIAASADMKRWWELTDPMQRPLDTRKHGEWWADMDEVFHTD